MKKLLFIMLFAAYAAHADDHTVGSGGDALRDLFNQARSVAVYNVSHLQWCSFNASTKQDTKDWILANQAAYTNDLQASDYRWVVDTQPTCGFTDRSSHSPIYLSYPTCSSTVGTKLSAAVFTVLHETVHHFGIADENQADEIAHAIQSADAGKVCPPQVADVFDSKICQGPAFSTDDARKFLPPARVTTPIGDYKVYARYRNCTKLSGCENWQIQPAIGLAYNGITSSLAPVSAILSADPGRPAGFMLTISQTMTSPSWNVVGGQVDGGAGTLYGNGNATYTFAGLTDFKWLGSTGNNMNGTFNKNCLWYGLTGSTAPQGNGLYQDAMIVIYGTH